MTKHTCAHCGWSGTDKTVEWNPLDEHRQCKDVVKCAQRAAEAKLARGPGQAGDGSVHGVGLRPIGQGLKDGLPWVTTPSLGWRRDLRRPSE